MPQNDPQGQPHDQQHDADVLRPGHAGEDYELIAPKRFNRPPRQGKEGHQKGHDLAGTPGLARISQE
jgi:hypothetical protein